MKDETKQRVPCRARSHEERISNDAMRATNTSNNNSHYDECGKANAINSFAIHRDHACPKAGECDPDAEQHFILRDVTCGKRYEEDHTNAGKHCIPAMMDRAGAIRRTHHDA